MRIAASLVIGFLMGMIFMKVHFLQYEVAVLNIQKSYIDKMVWKEACWARALLTCTILRKNEYVKSVHMILGDVTDNKGKRSSHAYIKFITHGNFEYYYDPTSKLLQVKADNFLVQYGYIDLKGLNTHLLRIMNENKNDYKKIKRRQEE